MTNVCQLMINPRISRSDHCRVQYLQIVLRNDRTTNHLPLLLFLSLGQEIDGENLWLMNNLESVKSIFPSTNNSCCFFVNEKDYLMVHHQQSTAARKIKPSSRFQHVPPIFPRMKPKLPVRRSRTITCHVKIFKNPQSVIKTTSKFPL